jgi:cold shock CspA family protein
MAKQAKAPAPETTRTLQKRTGTIVTLLFGSAHGFIRLRSHRKVFFHRSDLRQGTSFNDLSIGDTVRFDLFEDTVSGPRALQVERRPPRRR